TRLQPTGRGRNHPPRRGHFFARKLRGAPHRMFAEPVHSPGRRVAIRSLRLASEEIEALMQKIYRKGAHANTRWFHYREMSGPIGPFNRIQQVRYQRNSVFVHGHAAVARALFRARTRATHLDSGLVRNVRGEPSCFADVVFGSVRALLPFAALVRRDRLGAAGVSELGAPAISSPNRAAISRGSSTFAALAVAFDSGGSVPVRAINSFASTPRSTKRS